MNPLLAAAYSAALIGVACSGSEPRDERGRDDTAGAFPSGRGETAGQGGSSVVVVDDEAAGACPVGLDTPGESGTPGEGGSGSDTCVRTTATYPGTSELARKLCGCALEFGYGASVVCYPPPPGGAACDDFYPKACLPNDVCGGLPHGPGVVVCDSGSDPMTGAPACCYVVAGPCFVEVP